MNNGRLIVIDGIDGSGKSSQIELLVNYLKSQQIPFETINFPRYKDNIYGQLIKKYLTGQLGSIKQVSPYLIALAYAGDRMLAKDLIKGWLDKGKLVIANRYVSASKAHLGANLFSDQRKEFLDWLDKLEYETNGIPKEQMTILLNVDPTIGQNNVLSRQLPDIHENNLEHLKKAAQIYLTLAKETVGWYIVDCMEGDKMASAQKIHQQIIKVLNENKQI